MQVFNGQDNRQKHTMSLLQTLPPVGIAMPGTATDTRKRSTQPEAVGGCMGGRQQPGVSTQPVKYYEHFAAGSALLGTAWRARAQAAGHHSSLPVSASPSSPRRGACPPSTAT